MRSQRIVCAWIIIFFSSTLTFAKVLTPKAQLSRCYTQLTGKALPLGYPSTSLVVNGSKKAIDVCLELLNKTELEPTTGLLSEDNQESKNILNNFYQFHKSWFPTNSAEQMQDFSDESGKGTNDVYDFTEPSLMITKSLFDRDASLASAVTSSNGVIALRQDSDYVKRITGFTVSYPRRGKYGNNSDLDQNKISYQLVDYSYTFLSVPKIQVGELIGIKEKNETQIIPHIEFYNSASVVFGSSVPFYKYNPDIYRNLDQGGGLLGTPTFLMLNFGHSSGLKMNGATKLPRRWSLTIMNTLLCAQMPTLRESDIINDVRSGSTTPFRNNSACMRCHSTLDRMALTARNIVMAETGQDQINKGIHIASSYTPNLGSRPWPSEPENDFHLTSPEGVLYYRSTTGKLINEPVTGIADLGLKISQQDDYYTCAAKRYFQYFTGINVSLYDRTNPDNAALNKSIKPSEVADRKFVEQLGAKLKQTKSLKSLISDIMKSPYYIQSDFRGPQ